MTRFALCLGMVLLTRLCAFAGNSVINLSHYDLMRVDFDAMRGEGIVAAIHEASYPPSIRDEKYAARQEAAVRAGLLWGAYHYANGRDPVRQADHFLGVVSDAWRRASPSGRPAEVLLVLDFERNRHYPGGTMSPAQAVAFVEEIRRRTGKYPGLYAGENHLRAQMSRMATPAQRAVLSHCWLWIANYHVQPPAIGPWDQWTLWQYTGDGVCDLRPREAYPKSAANVRKAERNIFRGSDESLRAFWREHGWAPGD